MIPYSHQHVDKKDILAVEKVLKSDWLTQGPEISAFEKELAEYSKASYAVAVSNGTAALHLAYQAVGLKKGDEIITSANTFVATANMAVVCGAKPVFCDIRLDTYNIDESKIEKLITSKTKAIVPVHFAGHPCEMDKILAIAKKHNLVVIEDASHAIGAEYKKQKIGSMSHLTVFSFHPVKPITTGEGGAVLTNNEKYYQKMLCLRTHGISKDPVKQEKIGGWHYEMTNLGFNYRITDIQCALGKSQLDKLNKFQQQRDKIASYYFKKLKNIRGITLPANLRHIKHSWHLFVIRLQGSQIRKEAFQYLRENGIGVQVHYIPVYRQPYYQKKGFKNFKLSKTEDYYNTCISIPIYPDLTKKQADHVVNLIKTSLNKFS